MLWKAPETPYHTGPRRTLQGPRRALGVLGPRHSPPGMLLRVGCQCFQGSRTLSLHLVRPPQPPPTRYPSEMTSPPLPGHSQEQDLPASVSESQPECGSGQACSPPRPHPSIKPQGHGSLSPEADLGRCCLCRSRWAPRCSQGASSGPPSLKPCPAPSLPPPQDPGSDLLSVCRGAVPTPPSQNANSAGWEPGPWGRAERGLWAPAAPSLRLSPPLSVRAAVLAHTHALRTGLFWARVHQ